ncbi:WGR domain-containing protein [Corallococcus macrosporus]|uniref:Molybdenum metabolism regulator n=1 Tax=Corallococcus macrosporus DSM 14697 TaxID=1189310 RepID=A0A250JU76_9BACT|nr:WGR domain-containing protein [Corallococcus macrosporus]ATB47243.1 molybdenum metabolism regulator [Corallococcus macrosporus DSM 14697]
MPRYEFKEGSSSKFWEITLSGNSFTARWGRIGTDGQEKTQTFGSPAEAQKEHDKLVREKEKKGYVLAGKGDDDDGEGGGGDEPASNPELEAAILKDPDNVDAYLVYSDWLQGQGDPRGELIAIQHAAAQASGTEASDLKRKATAHIKKYQTLLLGELADGVKSKEISLEWHLGFIRSARLAKQDYDSEFDVVEAVGALLKHPSARFIRGLTVGMTDFEENHYSRVADAIVEVGGLKTLQELFLGDFQYPDETEISWTYLHDISGALKLLPDLRKLRLRGGELELGDVDLPELREFTVETGGLPLGAVKSIANAKWPKLERLEVWFGSDNYGAEGGVEDIQPILDGKGLPNLKQLGLRNSEFADALAQALPGAKVLPQLEKLDISMGTLTTEGARALADKAAAFAHLKQFDVTENILTDEGQSLLSKAIPQANVGNQREYEEDYRYAAVGE